MVKKLLDSIQSPDDLKKLEKEKLPELAKELRAFIIQIIATKEGHLGASLGVVELTIALQYVYNTPDDVLVWDVGHQAYAHKILTGRKDIFHTNRQLNGISGFPKRTESPYDAFGTGHSSTSISAVLGMAIASKISENKTKQHIAVIGDASIASGMAFEALNHAGVSNTNILIILNDNAIGIDPSVGALKNYFRAVKEGNTTSDTIFEALNFHYSGPVDGHNLDLLIKELEHLKTINKPKVLHIITKKGKGLRQAEKNQVAYHAPGKFDAQTGDLIKKNNPSLPSKFQDVFGETLVELAKQNIKIIGITPAMPTGSSLKLMMKTFPERAFDVGIAEQHAVTFSAGMATQGFKVYCVIYSTFLQRAYDQVIHDVCLQSIPVVFCIDRAGLVGEDGATHHGIFDISFLRCIPNLIVFAPRNEIELRNILFSAQSIKNPIAIRYPRGRGNLLNWKKPFEKIEIGKGVTLKSGTKIAVLSIGTLADNVTKAINELGKTKHIGHYDMRFIKPLDEELLHTIFTSYKIIITIEDGVKLGGFGSAILEFASKNGYTQPIEIVGISDTFPEHGTVEELQELSGISIYQIAETLKKHL